MVRDLCAILKQPSRSWWDRLPRWERAEWRVWWENQHPDPVELDRQRQKAPRGGSGGGSGGGKLSDQVFVTSAEAAQFWGL